jgi:protocatechuate 3,4-dioxygenase beta subunit
LEIEATILGLDGQPVAKSMVRFWREVPAGETAQDSDWRDPRTNKTWRAVHGSATGGTTRQTGLSPGTYLVTARDGHDYHGPFGASEPIQLDGSARQQSVKVRLQPGGTLRAVVTDAGNDQVLTRASVILTASDTFLPPHTMIHSVRDGDTFVYDHLPPGNYRVAASKRANAPDQLEYAMAGDAQPVTVAVGETRPIRIAVQGRPLTETEIGQRWPWIVHGRVTDKDGKPVEGATIRASAGWGSLFSAIIATTDKEGRYSGRFAQSGAVGMLNEDDPLNLVSAQVGAHKDGFAEVNLHRQGGMHAAYRQPRPDEKIPEYVNADRLFIRGQPREVNFVLVPAAIIQARVLDPTGKPVGDTYLSLAGSELPPASSVMASDKTDAEGKVLFTEIPAGYSWWFELSVERRKSARSVPMRFEAQRYDIVLQQQVEPTTGNYHLVVLSAHDAEGKDVVQVIVAGQPK